MRKGRRRFLRLRPEPLLQQAKRPGWIFGKAEQFEIFRADHAVTHQRVEVDDLFPVLRAVKKNRVRRIELLRFLQRKELRHFVERAETSGKYHQSARKMREPQLAHEKIVKLE